MAGIVLLALVGFWALGRVDGGTHTAAAPSPSSSPSASSVPSPSGTASVLAAPAGPFETALPPFGGVALQGLPPGSALNRRDLPAVSDAWTVVVRRADGSLGRHGAVVTFPVKAAPGEHRKTVKVGPVEGVTLAGQILWPLGGQHARVRGGLPITAIASLGERTDGSVLHAKDGWTPDTTVRPAEGRPTRAAWVRPSGPRG